VPYYKKNIREWILILKENSLNYSVILTLLIISVNTGKRLPLFSACKYKKNSNIYKEIFYSIRLWWFLTSITHYHQNYLNIFRGLSYSSYCAAIFDRDDRKRPKVAKGRHLNNGHGYVQLGNWLVNLNNCQGGPEFIRTRRRRSDDLALLAHLRP